MHAHTVLRQWHCGLAQLPCLAPGSLGMFSRFPFCDSPAIGTSFRANRHTLSSAVALLPCPVAACVCVWHAFGPFCARLPAPLLPCICSSRVGPSAFPLSARQRQPLSLPLAATSVLLQRIGACTDGDVSTRVTFALAPSALLRPNVRILRVPLSRALVLLGPLRPRARPGFDVGLCFLLFALRFDSDSF